MSDEKKWKERLICEKNLAFKAGTRFRGEIVGDQTIINLEAFARESTNLPKPIAVSVT